MPNTIEPTTDSAAFATIEEILEDLRNGKMVILTDDGDGIPNKDDATPYGYDGDDPDGDDDNDGIKNSMDPTPNGGTILHPVIFTSPFQLPIELRLV